MLLIMIWYFYHTVIIFDLDLIVLASASRFWPRLTSLLASDYSENWIWSSFQACGEEEEICYHFFEIFPASILVRTCLWTPFYAAHRATYDVTIC